MAELPGWTRERLKTAPDADVEAARLQVFVRGVRPILTRNIEHEIEQLRRADMKDAKARERLDQADRAQAREGLTKLAKSQAALRSMLGLDDGD